MRTPILLLLTGLLLGSSPIAAAAQDFRVLRDRRPFDPDRKEVVEPLLPFSPAYRVLLAGDSWAQYMWDDGSHSDLFDRFGHQDKAALSASLGEDPGPGYAGPEYAVSGSEARQWVDTANYPWLANAVAALQANLTIDLVMLSLGGNDMLAGKSGGGWYKDMDLDVPGSEAALLERIRVDTETVVQALQAVRPDLRVLLSSYDYPNFNVGFWCFAYACPKRRDLSRDPDNDLITDAEINAMMVLVEGERIDWTNAWDRTLFDHAVGLMHYAYGDGVSPPYALPYPGQDPPDYAPFPGGNPLRPSLRSCFRVPGVDADPIHLDYEGYQVKIAGQTETHFFPMFRGDATGTFFSEGGARDGWTDGATSGTAAVQMGRNATGAVQGILSFDTAAIPDDATVTSACFYLHRSALTGTNPFVSGALGAPTVDVAAGSFGAPDVEVSDATAPADATDAGFVAGSARANGYAVRVELSAAGLAALNREGTTQFRVRFPGAVAGTAAYVAFRDGDGVAPPSYGVPTLAEYMGTTRPFLDVTWSVPTAVAEGDPASPRPLLLPATPNPVRASTTIPFVLAAPGRARVEVFDVAGRHIAELLDRDLDAGHHSAVWTARGADGRRAAGGIYFARLTAAGRSESVRMVVLGD